MPDAATTPSMANASVQSQPRHHRPSKEALQKRKITLKSGNKPRFTPNPALQKDKRLHDILEDRGTGMPTLWKKRWGKLVVAIKGVKGDKALLFALEECGVDIRDLLHACVDTECPVPELLGKHYEPLMGCPRLADHAVADEASDVLVGISPDDMNDCLIQTLREVLKWRSLTEDDFDDEDDEDIPTHILAAISLLLTICVVGVPFMVIFYKGSRPMVFDVSQYAEEWWFKMLPFVDKFI